MLTSDQLKVAVAGAKQRFDLIRKKYPALKAKLVLSLPGGQTGIDDPLEKLLVDFPAMVIDGTAKTDAVNIASTLLDLQETAGASDPQVKHLKHELQRLAPHLNYNGKSQVEIRFDDLKYELVWKLQTDDLIERNLTPQTKASIRIVLGTLNQFLNPGTHPDGSNLT